MAQRGVVVGVVHGNLPMEFNQMAAGGSAKPSMFPGLSDEVEMEMESRSYISKQLLNDSSSSNIFE